MNNREINTAKKGIFKSSELLKTTTTNGLFPKVNTDCFSKSFNASSTSPTIPFNQLPKLPSRIQREPSFNDSDTPLADISNMLYSLSFFSGLPSSGAFIMDISGLMKLRPFKAGDTVIHYGDVAKCMYLILRGELGIISEDHEIEYATLTAGSFVGEIGVLFNTKRSATVVCKTKSLLASLTLEDIHSKLEKYPEIKEHLHLTGSERLQAIENVKNKVSAEAGGTEIEEKKGKAGFNVKRSSSFRSFSPNASFNAGQGTGLSSSANATMGLLTPDTMTLIKSRASSRRSSLNPETAFLNSIETSNDSSLPIGPAFTRGKSYEATEENGTDQLKLNKSFNASRRMSSIRFELGDLAVSVSDESPSIRVPQINISPFTADFQMMPEKIHNNDKCTDFTLPVFNIETPSMINLAQEEEIKIVPTFMIESPSKINLAQKEKLEKEEKVVETISVVKEPAESNQCESRRRTIAVWTDPKLIKISQTKVEGNKPFKQSKVWKSIESEEVDKDTEVDGDNGMDQDELAFLNTSVGDSYDQELSILEPNTEVLMYLLNYLSFEDVFKLRGICVNMRDIITEAQPRLLRNIDLSLYFRKLNDRGVVAVSKFCGDFIEKINLHAAYLLTDRSIEKLAKSSRNLTHLNVSDVWEFTDVSMDALSRYCPALVHVDLSNCRKLTNSGLLGLLESCSKLSVLSLSYCKSLSDKVLDHEAWSRIKELNLHRCLGLGDRGFEFWTLVIDDFRWAGNESRQLASSTEWATINSEENLGKGSLYISGGAIDNISIGNNGADSSFEDKMNEWGSDGSVKQLRDAEPFDSNSINISESSGPKILINESSEAASDPSKTITGFSLRFLDLRDCSFLSDTAIASIASVCSQLRVLNLSFCCSLTEDFGRYLGCKKLSGLDVSFCGGAVSDEFILEISTGLHHLTGLSIRGCVQVTDEGVGHLLKYSRLTKINFTQCKGISLQVKDQLNARYEIIENNSICGGIAAWK